MTNREVLLQFPGVGSQHTGMCQTLYKTQPIARQTFEEASDVLSFDLATICFDQTLQHELNRLEYSQTAIVTASVAVFRVVSQHVDLSRSQFIGYSLGEYSALCCAGAVTFEDVISLVWDRGLIMRATASKVGGAMMWVVNLAEGSVSNLCEQMRSEGHDIWISGIDSDEKLTVSGSQNAIEAIGPHIVSLGGIPVPTSVNGPYHSPLMQEATDKMSELLANTKVSAPSYPVISNMRAVAYESIDAIRRDLAQSLTHPIQWQRCLNRAKSNGAELAAEIGPKEVLSYIWQKNFPDDTTIAVSSDKDTTTLRNQIIEVNRSIDKRLLGRALRTLSTTRNLNPDVVSHKATTVAAFRELAKLDKQLDSDVAVVESQDIRPKIETLSHRALKGMRLPPPQFKKRMSYILNQSKTTGNSSDSK